MKGLCASDECARQASTFHLHGGTLELVVDDDLTGATARGRRDIRATSSSSGRGRAGTLDNVRNPP